MKIRDRDDACVWIFIDIGFDLDIALQRGAAGKGFTFIDSKSYAKKSVEKALQVALDPTTFFCWGLYIRDAPCEGKRPPELTLCA